MEDAFRKLTLLDVVGVSSIEQLNEVVFTEECEKLTGSDMEILCNAVPAKVDELHM